MSAPAINPGREPMCADCDLRITFGDENGISHGVSHDCGRDWSLPVDGMCWECDEEGDEG